MQRAGELCIIELIGSHCGRKNCQKIPSSVDSHEMRCQDQMEKIRKHFYFSGRVQGVGFRYRSYYIAQAMGVTGWVRNLWDERVEMEIQGTRDEIREMVERLSQQNFVEIEGIETKEIPLEEESSFRIRG